MKEDIYEIKADLAEHCKATLDLLDQVNREYKKFPKSFLEIFTLCCVHYAYIMKGFDEKFPEGVKISVDIRNGKRKWQS